MLADLTVFMRGKKLYLINRLVGIVICFGFLLGSQANSSSLPPCPEEVEVSSWSRCVGTVIYNNGDKYIVEINNFNQLGEDEINLLIDEYSDYSKERLSSKMSEIINEDVFETARVNLDNLVF